MDANAMCIQMDAAILWCLRGKTTVVVGIELWLRMKVADELACYVVRTNGTDDCRVGFMAKEYAAGEKGAKLDGVIVRIVDVFLPDNPNRTARRLYHHNRGYAVAEIVSQPFGKKEE